MSSAAKVEEVMRRAASAGQRSWPVAMLQRRTGLSYDTLRKVMRELSGKGLVERLSVREWRWIAKKK